MTSDYQRDGVDVVVGAQAGSEGKGAVVAHLSRGIDYNYAIRPGSSNAGHTVYSDGMEFVQQVIPSTAVIDPDTKVILAPESSFAMDELCREMHTIDTMLDDHTRKFDPIRRRLIIDPKAAIIDDRHRAMERDRKLGKDIGSTVHGCGAVRVEKIWRSAGDVKLAGDVDALTESGLVNDERPTERALQPGALSIIEGTQGTHLSMNQSEHWPFCTSRDATASAFLSAAGLPPSCVRDTWLVARRYPIRVGGNSGGFPTEEIDFETIAERAGYDQPPVEYTSVTDKKRRIFEWSFEQVARSIRLSDPNWLALTFIDHINADDHGVRSWDDLSGRSQDWVWGVQQWLMSEGHECDVGLLKTGPGPNDVIDLRADDDWLNYNEPRSTELRNATGRDL